MSELHREDTSRPYGPIEMRDERLAFTRRWELPALAHVIARRCRFITEPPRAALAGIADELTA